MSSDWTLKRNVTEEDYDRKNADLLEAGERIAFLLRAIEKLECAESQRIYDYGRNVLKAYSTKFGDTLEALEKVK